MKKYYYREYYCNLCEYKHYIIFDINKDEIENKIIINKKSEFLKIKKFFKAEKIKIEEKIKYSMSCDNLVWGFHPIFFEKLKCRLQEK